MVFSKHSCCTVRVHTLCRPCAGLLLLWWLWRIWSGSTGRSMPTLSCGYEALIVVTNKVLV
jgi:hypothetical protein